MQFDIRELTKICRHSASLGTVRQQCRALHRWLPCLSVLIKNLTYRQLIWETSVRSRSLSEIRTNILYILYLLFSCLSHWPRGLRRGSAATRLMGLRVRIPRASWISVCCECCVLSGRGLWDGLITRPEESYRVWCV